MCIHRAFVNCTSKRDPRGRSHGRRVRFPALMPTSSFFIFARLPIKVVFPLFSSF